MVTYLRSKSVQTLVLNKYNEDVIRLFSEKGFKVLYYYTDAADEAADFLRKGGFGVFTNFVLPKPKYTYHNEVPDFSSGYLFR